MVFDLLKISSANLFNATPTCRDYLLLTVAKASAGVAMSYFVYHPLPIAR
jgi:hypothetical protein